MAFTKLVFIAYSITNILYNSYIVLYSINSLYSIIIQWSLRSKRVRWEKLLRRYRRQASQFCTSWETGAWREKAGRSAKKGAALIKTKGNKNKDCCFKNGSRGNRSEDA